MKDPDIDCIFTPLFNKVTRRFSFLLEDVAQSATNKLLLAWTILQWQLALIISLPNLLHNSFKQPLRILAS
jgi:hypothetical protein